jgi:hypothetical protein
LSIDDPQATVTRPVNLTGHLLDGTMPIAGVTVTVSDGSGVIGTAGTDATGAWSLAHTFDNAGGVTLTATTPADGTRAAGYAERWIDVDRLLASIDATVPATIPIGGTADITGTLTFGGQPAPQSPVDWQALCQDGEAIPNYYGQVTTADDGTFDIPFDPARCASMEFRLNSPGTPNVWYYISPPYDITVPWHRYAVTADGPSTVYIGDSYDVTFTTTRDGQPRQTCPSTYGSPIPPTASRTSAAPPTATES